MTEEKLEDIVLYNGSLEELNATDNRLNEMKNYRIAGLEFASPRYDLVHEEVTKRVRILLKERGYDGLVNKRMIVDNGGTYIEGTPIKETRKIIEEQVGRASDISH